jgi:hypothetical protein
MLAWLKVQKVSFHGSRVQRTMPLRFMVERPPGAVESQLIAPDADWLPYLTSDAKEAVEWRLLQPEDNLQTLGLRHVALRLRPNIRAEPSSQAFSTFVSNRRGTEHHLVRWFLKGRVGIMRGCADLVSLAWGSHPEAMAGPTAEGRFLLACVTFNVISAIRKMCLGKDENNASLSRFRGLLIHIAGQVAIRGKLRRLKLFDAEAAERFRRVNEVFALPERALSKRG